MPQLSQWKDFIFGQGVRKFRRVVFFAAAATGSGFKNLKAGFLPDAPGFLKCAPNFSGFRLAQGKQIQSIQTSQWPASEWFRDGWVQARVMPMISTRVFVENKMIGIIGGKGARKNDAICKPGKIRRCNLHNALKKFSPIKMPDRADYRAFERNFFPVFSGTPLAKGNSGPPNCAANEQLKFESHEHA